MHQSDKDIPIDTRVPYLSLPSIASVENTNYSPLESIRIEESISAEKISANDPLAMKQSIRDLTTVNSSQTPPLQAFITEEKIATLVPENSMASNLPIKATIRKDSATVSYAPRAMKVSRAESLLFSKTNTEKSISERAFERTDSSRNSSILSNPYAKQVADLTDEFLSTSSPLAIELSNKSNKIEQVLSVNKEQNNIFKPIQLPAQLLSSVPPKYPSNAKRKSIEIDIQVTFTIDKHGYVRDIQYYGKGKVSYFRSAIRSALEKWRFTPASYNNQSVESTMSKIFSFSIAK